MDFERSIFENRAALGRPFLAAHRGVCGANIPCNTLAAYKIALDQGADVVEMDVTKSRDGEFFVFHPGMEPVFLNCGKYIPEMMAAEVRELPLLNQDRTPTHYRVPTLQEVFALLKGRSYINVDKFWTDVPGITGEIRKAGVEKQVIVKTPVEEEALNQVERYAPDLMYCAVAWHKDAISEKLLKRDISYIGIEALFDREEDDIISDAYIQWLHDRGLLMWVNAIVYNEREIISALHTDDAAVTGNADFGWGWLVRKNVDFIQTDWLASLKKYLEK